MITAVYNVSAHISVPEGLWLIGNVDYMGFYRTNYDISMWKRIVDQLHTDHRVRTPDVCQGRDTRAVWTAYLDGSCVAAFNACMQLTTCCSILA